MLPPNTATYQILIQTLCQSGNGALAVKVCSEAHFTGVFHHFSLPGLVARRPTSPTGTTWDQVNK